MELFGKESIIARKLTACDIKADESDHIVFEDHHEPIIDYRTFAITQELLKKRTNRIIACKYDNVYSGFRSGDCGSPMFPMSRKDLALHTDVEHIIKG